MQHERDIEQTLNVIRRLMERGEKYEAITGRGALLSGLAALAVAAGVHFVSGPDPSRNDGGAYLFIGAWAALALACAGSVAITALRGSWRARAEADEDESGRRVSAQARAVVRAVLPAYLLATVATTVSMVVVPRGATLVLPAIWMALHGVAILATSYHAPRRLIRLGWTFLIAGCALLIPWPGLFLTALTRPNLVMALSFGGLHLGYGLLCKLRPLREDE